MKATEKWILSTKLFSIMMIFGFTGEASAESFAPQEIYNQDGLKVSITDSEEDSTSTTITFLFENDREENIYVTSQALSVNGYAEEYAYFGLVIDAGKKNSDSITINKDDFCLQDVDTIASVEFYLEIVDNDTGDIIADTEPIQIISEGNENYVQEYDDSGEVLYDSDGIKIISKGLGDEEVWGSPLLSIYVENNSEKYIQLSSYDTSINDCMFQDTFYFGVPAGKHGLAAFYFSDYDLMEYQIETIEEIETTFTIGDNSTAETLVESIPATVSFQ